MDVGETGLTAATTLTRRRLWIGVAAVLIAGACVLAFSRAEALLLDVGRLTGCW